MASVSEAFAPSYGNFLDSVSFTLLPSAVDDSATTTPGHSVLIPVLANDCGTGLTVHAIAAVSHGTATVSGTSIKYTAPATFVGTVTFAYTLVDSDGDPATALVTVHVVRPAGPKAVPERSIGRTGVVQVVHPTVHAGWTLRLVDAQGHATTKISIAGEGVYAVVGRTLTFTPAAGFVGDADAVSYRVSDAFGQSATSTYRATVFEALFAPTLPDTGADYAGVLTAGLTLIGAGLLLVLAGRRRTRVPVQR
jgi:LPXTG-motif cell wall-anchored protein